MKKIENILNNKNSILYMIITSGSILGGLTLYLPSGTIKLIPIISLLFLIWFSLKFIKNMKTKISLLLICLLLFIVNLFSIFGISPIHEYQLSRINKRAEELINNGRYLDSIQLLQHHNTEKIIYDVSNNVNSKRLQLLAVSLWREDSMNDALRIIQDADKLVDPDSILRGEIFSTMANIYKDREEYNLAEKYFKEAINKGNNSPEVQMDLLICLNDQGRLFNPDQVYEVINQVNNDKIVRNQIIKSEGYHLLASISNDREKQAEYYYQSYSILDDIDYLTERRLQSYTDWIMVKYEDRNDYSREDLDLAYQETVGILNQFSTKNDIDRAKIDMSLKFAILYKNLAYKFRTDESFSESDELFFKSIEILESTRDLVKSQNIDANIRLKWWLQRIDFYSFSEDLSNMISALSEAEKVVEEMNFYDKKNLSAITEFYQVKGLINYYYKDHPEIQTDVKIAESYLLKSFSLKYLFEIGDLRDYRRTVAILEKIGISGLPDNFMISE